MPVDGSAQPAPITPGGKVRDNDAALSPNGDMVAITRPDLGIWTVGLGQGNALALLTRTSGDQDPPAWSPGAAQSTFKRRDEL